MSDLQWAVFVVVNHTRREILAEIGMYSPHVPKDLADIATWCAPWHERNVARRTLVRHWDFDEDRMLVPALECVDDRRAAHRLAKRLRGDVQALVSRWPRAQELVGDGYRVLGGPVERADITVWAPPGGSRHLAAAHRPGDGGSRLS